MCCIPCLLMLLMAYDPIQHTQTVVVDIRWKHLHKKDLIFIQGGITLRRKLIPGYISIMRIKVSLLQRENTKKIEESFGIRMLFPKRSAENVHSWYPYKQFWPKPRQRDETVFKLCHFYCLSICLILTVVRFVGANLHFRFHNLCVFDMLFYLKSYGKYLSDI